MNFNPIKWKLASVHSFFLFTTLLFSQTKILSWNIENFGKSKSETQLNFIANTIKDYDIITIQEVVAGYGGAQSVTKLVEILNQKVQNGIIKSAIQLPAVRIKLSDMLLSGKPTRQNWKEIPGLKKI